MKNGTAAATLKDYQARLYHLRREYSPFATCMMHSDQKGFTRKPTATKNPWQSSMRGKVITSTLLSSTFFNECADKFRYIHDTYVIFYNQISYDRFGNNRRELQVTWNEGLSVGIDSVDDQHKVLLSKINFLVKSILEGKGDDSVLNILTFLKEYSEDHFKHEEDLMRTENHPDLEAHIRAHDIFRRNFIDIIDKINKEGVKEHTLAEIETTLIRWLLNHIIEMDSNIKTQTA